ncbi:MAG: hypothetical protein KBH01_00730 [Breznakibacter sp.]|nr:hypothetical protein [Breznakibacter sp.]
MINKEVQNLFYLIDFLYTEMLPKISKSQDVIKDVIAFRKQMNAFNPSQSYHDKVRVDELKHVLAGKWKLINEELLMPIREKIISLNISDNGFNQSMHNRNIGAVYELREIVEPVDVSSILDYRTKYEQFVCDNRCHPFEPLLFDSLDHLLRPLFDYFQKSKEPILFDAEKDAYLQGGRIILDLYFDFSWFWFKFKINPTNIYSAGYSELSSLKALDFLSHDHYCQLLERFRISVPEELKSGLDWRDLNEWINSEISNAEESPLGQAFPLQSTNRDLDLQKYKAKHYLLAYLFECNAKGESYPIGKKKELERIGNELMGVGKGNRFYKLFNEITNKYDINIENQLIEIGGEYWRKAVIELSKSPELVEKYLQSKQL